MRIEAYVCDMCECIATDENILELRTEPLGIFGNDYTFTAINPVRKNHFSNVHFCLDCFKAHVDNLLHNIDRKKNDKEYTYHYNLYKKKFYENVYHKALLRNTARNR